MTPYYVTTPIYYVNDYPHIGHTYTTIVGDVLARFQRGSGRPVRFLTGTDEHGQKIERAAQERGIEPLALADDVVERYHTLWRSLGISHDDFIRTTEQRHRLGVEEVIRRLEAAGDLYVDQHEGWYCSGCELYYTEKELGADRACPVHETPAEWSQEENVFFRLSRFQEPLLEWYARDPAPVWPSSRLNEVKSFVEGGLRDLSVSRADLDWGIPFLGHEGQTIYVWLDALTNYISALGFGQDDSGLYDRFWNGEGAKVHLVGKDILRFHAVYWPAFLMAAGLPLPSTVVAHGWWLRNERKVSKSTGNVARLDGLVESLGADPVRYFLMRDMVFGQDSQYSDEDLLERYNTDLANGLGNTVSRLVTLSRKAFEGKTPPTPCDDNPLREVAAEQTRVYLEEMEGLRFERALRALWRIVDATNEYLVSREPWNLIRDEGPSPRLSRILWNGLEATRIAASALAPFLPESSESVLKAVGANARPGPWNESLAWGELSCGVELKKPEPIFPRVDLKAYFSETEEGPASAEKDPTPEAKNDMPDSISIDDFFATQLHVGTVVEAHPIPKSEKLLRVVVDLGEETPRTVVAGIAQQYDAQEIVGRQVVVVANLQPAKLMGVESQGMVLAASEEGAPVLLAPDRKVPNGTRVR